MRNTLWLLIILVALAACNRGAPAATQTGAPTVPPTIPATLKPTTTSPPPTAEATRTPAPTLTPNTGAPLTDQAEFVADVTVPDGSDFAPGTKFTKTWRIKNAGTATWTKDYALVFDSGTQMAAENAVPFPGDVPPGETVDLSVEMTAPATLGVHVSLWQLRNAGGQTFGVGEKFDDPIYAQIDVVAAAAPTQKPATAAATRPPAPTFAGTLAPVNVTKVTLSVDNAAVTNDCPHTFVFTAILYVEGGGTIRYQLEASTTTEGFTFNLPAPIDSTFTSNGPHTFGVQYTLEMRSTVSGEAWLRVLSPNDLRSDKVAFSLTCPPTPTAPPPATPITPSPTPAP